MRCVQRNKLPLADDDGIHHAPCSAAQKLRQGENVGIFRRVNRRTGQIREVGFKQVGQLVGKTLLPVSTAAQENGFLFIAPIKRNPARLMHLTKLRGAEFCEAYGEQIALSDKRKAHHTAGKQRAEQRLIDCFTAEQASQRFLHQVACFCVERFADSVENLPETLDFHGLEQIIIHARLNCSARELKFRVAGDNHCMRPRIQLPDALRQFNAIDARHTDVRYQHMDVLLRHQPEGIVGAAGEQNGVKRRAVFLADGFEERLRGTFIIYDQNGVHRLPPHWCAFQSVRLLRRRHCGCASELRRG